MRVGRIENSLVVETLDLPEGVSVADVFHPVVASQFQELPGNVQAGWHFDGNSYSPPIVEDINFDALKRQLKASIDEAAEAERLKYITAGAGQAMTYQQKSDEAKRYLAASDPDADDYPLLSAEVGVTAADLAGVAQVVNAAFAQWQVIGAAIEKTRLATKAAIDAAATAEEAQSAFEGASWPVI